MNLRKMLKVIFVDFFGLLVGILNGFFLPKVFTIDQYSFFKTFGLYATYVGMFHFGFSDGLYILYGGKKTEEIDKSKFRAYYNFLIKLELIITAFLLIISVILIKYEPTLIYFSIYILPFQIVHFFRLYYRAIGEFDKYSVLQGTITVFNLINTLIIIICFSRPTVLIILQIISYFSIAIFISIKFCKEYNKSRKISINEFFSISKLGFIIMIANTFSALFFSLDRWFIKFKFPKEDFAYYSFAVSMLNLFVVLITSITILFYPYFARNIKNKLIIKKVKIYLIIITSFAPIGCFILKFIVEHFLTKYILSITVLSILILTIPFMSIVNVLYSNLYKSLKKGNLYLKTVIKMFLIALVLNCLFYIIYKDAKMIAIATLISFFIWYIYSSRHFEGLNVNIKELGYFIIYFVAYFGIRYFNINDLISCILFSIIMILNIFVFYKLEFIDMIKFLINKIQYKSI